MRATKFHDASGDDLSALRLRQVFAGYPTGIVVIAAEVGGQPTGLSASSFVSVSLNPPLVSLSFGVGSTSWPRLRGAPLIGLSVLAEDQAGISRSLRRPSVARFSGVDLDTEGTAVHIRDAVATFTVTLAQEISAGDHTVALFRVAQARRDAERRPLVFFNSDLHQVTTII